MHATMMIYRPVMDRLREQIIHGFLWLAATLAVVITAAIMASLMVEAHHFFQKIAPADFFFGLQWSPQTALRVDQAGSSGAFGAVPLFTGTLLIAVIALVVAVPVGLLSACCLSTFMTPGQRAWIKPMLEILAGIPTVVYGFFAALTVAPLVRDAGQALGLGVSGESALAAGLVMGVMMIPFISSFSDDVLQAVPQALRDAGHGLGSTRAEILTNIVLPAALPGIAGAVLLAASRAIGETMIVVMAAGLAANLTINPLSAVTTVTAQMTALLVGDQAFDSAKTLSVFALGLTLFVVTMALNLVALLIVRHYRERYD